MADLTHIFPSAAQFDKMNGYLAAMAGMGNVQLLDAYDVQRAVRNGTIGKILSVGDYFKVKRGGTEWLFEAAAIDYDVPANPAFTHSLRLLMHNCFDNVVHDAREALYYAETALAPGTYWFLYSYNKKYGSFTTTVEIPAGGQIAMVDWDGAPDYMPSPLATYASKTSTVKLETLAVTKTATAPTVGTQLLPVNDGARVGWGSNNWLQSGGRQWLNSDKASGWWVPSNNYDRPMTDTMPGFLHGIDPDLRACIGKVRLRTGLNPFDNKGVYGFSDNEELVFYPSLFEVGLGNYGTVYEGPVALDGTVKQVPMPLFTKNADRIKYLNGVARGWWVRSPYPYATYAHYVYLVGLAGADGYTNAVGGYGAVPACVII